jgi:hypothetical protein
MPVLYFPDHHHEDAKSLLADAQKYAEEERWTTTLVIGRTHNGELRMANSEIRNRAEIIGLIEELKHHILTRGE